MCSAKESWLESEKSWVEMYPSEKKKKKKCIQVDLLFLFSQKEFKTALKLQTTLHRGRLWSKGFPSTVCPCVKNESAKEVLTS